MSKKTRKLQRHKRSARRESRSARPARRDRASRNNAASTSTAWLQIAPLVMEEDPAVNSSRGFFLHRNGRRQPADLDLYIPEHDGRIR